MAGDAAETGLVEADASVGTLDGGALDDAALEALVRQHMAEAAGEEKALMAAFHAGTGLRLLAPADLFDPIDQAIVRAPAGAVLVVAAHEGHVMIGQLVDNSHSIAVLHEEAHRWYKRKYFLPLAILVDRDRVEVLAPRDGGLETSGARVRGLEADGQSRELAVAIRRVEALDLRDETSLLPRGTTLILRHGAVGRDPKTGDRFDLLPGAEVTVVAALGDFAPASELEEADVEVEEPLEDGEGAAPLEPSAPERVPDDVLRVDFGGQILDLPASLLADLDPDRDILTWRALEARQLKEESRRRFLRLALAGGVAVAAVASGVPLFASRARDRRRFIGSDEGASAAAREEAEREAEVVAFRQTLRLVVPEVAMIYGLASAGGKYWYDVRGAIMDLAARGSLEAVRTMIALSEPLSAALSRLYSAYRTSYYRQVHVGWSEHRHYKTDSNGKRTYSHSTWSKRYSHLWVEPAGLSGHHSRLESWRSAAMTWLGGSRALASQPLFDLLAAEPGNAEATFRLARVDLDGRRDLATSAAWMALAAGVPMLGDALVHDAPALAPRRDRVPRQRELGLGVGLALGMFAAHRFRKRLGAQLEQNKYDLGTCIDEEVARVPTLDIEAAFAEYYTGRRFSDWPDDLLAWSADIATLPGRARDHVYVHGMGFDHGRPLDPCVVSGAAVRATAPGVAADLLRHQPPVAAFVVDPANGAALLPALQNGIGTRIIKRQITEDEGEAKGANLRRAGWFSLPIWGMALLDGALRA